MRFIRGEIIANWKQGWVSDGEAAAAGWVRIKENQWDPTNYWDEHCKGKDCNFKVLIWQKNERNLKSQNMQLIAFIDF